MIVREATLEDRARWDSFVDSEGGSFFHYFDWKYVHEERGGQLIPLMIETSPSQLVGIFPMVKTDRPLYSTLDTVSVAGGAEGLVLGRGLCDSERGEATSALIHHVDAHYSRRCSAFRLTEAFAPVGNLSEEPTAVLIHNGFRFRYDRTTHLPCNVFLELKQPFEDNVWKGWSRQLRQDVNRAARSGVVVIQDREFKYAEVFADMLQENHRRHKSKPPTRGEIKMRLNVFRDRSKLFVALLDGRPVVALLCYYTSLTCYLSKVGSYEKDTDDANKLCYKVAIEDACNAGYGYADLGMSVTSNLAFFKQRFRGTRVPLRIYEKGYSIPRTLMEKTPVLVSSAWHDRSYIWRNRRKIWDRIVHI
jgi:hypothetical protein